MGERDMPIQVSADMRQKIARGSSPRIVVVESLPWGMFDEICQERCQRNHNQTLQRIAERGGFSAMEVVANLVGLKPRSNLMDEVIAHRTLYTMRALYFRQAASPPDPA